MLFLLASGTHRPDKVLKTRVVLLSISIIKPFKKRKDVFCSLREMRTKSGNVYFIPLEWFPRRRLFFKCFRLIVFLTQQNLVNDVYVVSLTLFRKCLKLLEICLKQYRKFISLLEVYLISGELGSLSVDCRPKFKIRFYWISPSTVNYIRSHRFNTKHSGPPFEEIWKLKAFSLLKRVKCVPSTRRPRNFKTQQF